MVRVWTFKITGGELLPIRLKLANTPLLDHEGGTTLWKMVGGEKEASAVEEVLKLAGCIIARYSEEQTPEQEAERLDLLGRSGRMPNCS